MEKRSHTRQLLGSLLVAVAIVALAIALVTAKFGATSASEREALEERQEQQEEALEERQDRLEDERR